MLRVRHTCGCLRKCGFHASRSRRKPRERGTRIVYFSLCTCCLPGLRRSCGVLHHLTIVVVAVCDAEGGTGCGCVQAVGSYDAEEGVGRLKLRCLGVGRRWAELRAEGPRCKSPGRSPGSAFALHFAGCRPALYGVRAAHNADLQPASALRNQPRASPWAVTARTFSASLVQPCGAPLEPCCIRTRRPSRCFFCSGTPS